MNTAQSFEEAKLLCAAEPIHRLGRVQSHGFLLVCDIRELSISFLSSNVLDLLGLATSELLGKPLSVLHESLSPLANLVAASVDLADGTPFRAGATLHLGTQKRAFEVLVHRWDGRLIVEGQPTTEHYLSQQPDAIHIVNSISQSLVKSEDVLGLCELASSEIQRLTGYQRVLAYEFDANWNGKVIAECPRAGEPARFLGLQFPASDIPPQARALYQAVPLRVIADTHDDGCPIIGVEDALGTIDLSHGLLRCPSAMHLKYMRHMGVRSSIAISLLFEGRLWGLIVAHDDNPHIPPNHVIHALRVVCSVMGQIASTRLLGLKYRKLQTDDRALLDLIERTSVIASTVRDNVRIWPLMKVEIERWFGAHGSIFFQDGKVLHAQVSDEGLPEACIRAALNRTHHEVFATSSLYRDGLVPDGFAVAGLMWIPFAMPGHGVLLWRREVTRDVLWGGDPNEPMVLNTEENEIGPRKSFEQWKEVRRNECIPWTEAQIEAAKRIANQWYILIVEEERRRAEATIRLLEAGIVRLHDGFVIFKASRQRAPVVVFSNPLFDRLLNNDESSIGALPAFLDEALIDPQASLAIRNAVSQKKATTIEFMTCGGRWMDLALTPMGERDSDGDFWAAILRDITEKKTLQDSLLRINTSLESTVATRTAELVSAKELADSANRAKSEFLANMSHELRSPLHSILGFTRLLMEDSDSPDDKMPMYLKKVERNAGNLLALVNDLLDAAKIDSQEFSIHPTSCDLVEIAQSVVEEFQSEAGAKPLIGVLLPVVAVYSGDPFRLAQVLRNLLANAVKFSPPGFPVELELAAADGGWLVAVRDLGQGIPPDELETIFDRFSQSSKTKTGAGGTGLGLPIARGIIEQHGGWLKAENRPGGGAEFSAFLPDPS